LTIFHVLISWSGKAFEFSSTGFSFLDCTYYPNLRSLSPTVKSVLQDRVSDVMRSEELESNWGHLSYLDDSQKLLDQERNEYSLFYYRMKDSKSGEDTYDRVSVFFETLYRNFKNENYPKYTLLVSNG